MRKRRNAAGAQLSEAPAVEAECEENPVRRPVVLETGPAKTELSKKPTRPSLRFQ